MGITPRAASLTAPPITEMRLAYFVNTFPAISETFVLDQITAMIDRGHDITIFADRPRDDHPVHPAVDQYDLIRRTRYRPPLPATPRSHRIVALTRLMATTIHRAPRRCLASLSAPGVGRAGIAGEVWRWAVPCLRAKPFDLLHAHHGPNGAMVQALRDIDILRAPLLTTLHGSDVLVIPRLRGRHVYERLFDAGNHFTVNTAFLESRAMELGAPRDRLARLPVGIRPGDIRLVPMHERDDVPLRLLSVGRLVPAKGVPFAVDAAAILRDRGIDFRYDIIGDGALEDVIRARITAHDLGDIVRLHGAKSREDVRSFYERAHILLAPGVVAPDGSAEAQGLALVEALATGMLVVASDVGGMTETLHGHDAGTLVPPEDPESIADAVTGLLGTRETWSERAKRGRESIVNRFDHDALMDRLIECYAALTRGGTTP